MGKEKTVEKMGKEKKSKLVSTKEKTNCNDVDCPFHGKLNARGKIFQGIVKRKNPRRIMIEFEGVVYIHKYERYTKKRTRIHARLPKCMEEEINVGDLVKIRECRPLSKIIHFVVVERLNSNINKKTNSGELK